MSMNGNAMGTAVATAIKVVNPNAEISEIEPYWQAICTAMVTYMTSNAAVQPGTFSNSGGPVTGTGSIS